jgi:hypothetical protein
MIRVLAVKMKSQELRTGFDRRGTGIGAIEFSFGK